MDNTVQIHLDLREPASQTFWVKQSWKPCSHRLSIQLPVWTPGSYTVRDHVQHLHSLELHSGESQVPLRRSGPSSWRADLSELTTVEVRYAVEARDLTVRTCFLDPTFASLCLAGAVMEVEGCRWQTHQLEISVPDTWEAFVPLQRNNHFWIADDFDALVDSPVHAGPFKIEQFLVKGYTHELLLIGSPPSGWPKNLLSDISAVCEATCRLMDSPPAAGDRYQLVLQMRAEGYGGLEHDHGAVLQFNWHTLAQPDGYRKLLQLVGHEYLHQWNVRRLRPQEYRPYDYSQAIVSESLWFAEGITSYFDLITTMIAGCSDRKSFLVDLSEELSRVLMTPGREVQSLACSSEEAWVKLYKASPPSRDSQVSYYGLGAATAFCLDVRLRQKQTSLARLVRKLWQTHGVCRRGYNREDVLALVREHDQSLAEDLISWLDQPASLPLQSIVSSLGLRLEAVASKDPYHGLTLKEDSGQMLVRRVAAKSPALKANLVVGDELIAISGRRLRRLNDLPLLLRGQSSVAITYSRHGHLAETLLNPDEGVDRWQLDWDPRATTKQMALRDRWFQIL